MQMSKFSSGGMLSYHTKEIIWERLHIHDKWYTVIRYHAT